MQDLESQRANVNRIDGGEAPIQVRPNKMLGGLIGTRYLDLARPDVGSEIMPLGYWSGQVGEAAASSVKMDSFILDYAADNFSAAS